jgi:hypothetical protein
MAHLHRAPSIRRRELLRANRAVLAAMTAAYLVCAVALYAIAVFGEPAWVRPYLIGGLVAGYGWWVSIPLTPERRDPEHDPGAGRP